ncbi:MAG TPA: LysR family transcriptional regulator [Chthoniobacter sp.]
MNIHHLELFYYVARHGGVSAAARRIPYGIQQPAISAQILQLEDNLGATLFHRRPFKLTKTGDELYRFIEPFFGGIEEVGKKLRGGSEANLRVGAPELILREYLPELLRTMRRRTPGLNFTLISAAIDEIESDIMAQQIDIGISPLIGRRADGVKRKELVRVPMALMVPKNSKLLSDEQIWKQDRISEPLIGWPKDHPIWRVFQVGLQKRKAEWFPSLELNSQELMARYVTEGFGIGLVLVEPGAPPFPGTRLLELTSFPTIPYGLLWTGSLSSLQKAFFEEAEALAAAVAAREDDRRTKRPI